MPSYQLSQSIADGSETLSNLETITSDAKVAADIAVPHPSTNLEVDLPIDKDGLKLFYLAADQNLTIKTNATSGQDQTLNVVANEPLVWSNKSLQSCPITFDITKLFITSAASADATLKVRALLDVTP